MDAITGLLDKKKIGGKDLPTEVFIKKKCEPCLRFRRTYDWLIFWWVVALLVAFYKAKQVRLTGSEKGYAEAITISPAEGLSPVLALFDSIN